MTNVNDTGETVRHPLGLPPGSVRGVLSLLIVIQFWLLLMLPDSKKVPIPLNLYLLMSLVGLFFVSHGKTIGHGSVPSPLYLPGGTLRLIIFGGTAAVVGYIYANHPERLTDRLQLDPGQLANWPYLVGAYVGGFAVGYIFRHMPFRNNWLFQSFVAWMSLLAMALLFIEIFLRAFVQSTLKEQLDLKVWEAIVTAITTCYFGTRS
jgi:hypothetical protein